MTSAGLTSTRLLGRNVVINFLGQAAPMLAAIATIPLLIAGIGVDRFAVLTIAWVLIGYFGLFDLGLSRALTQMVAVRLGSEEQGEVPALVWNGIVLMTLLGVIGGAIIAILSPWLVESALNVPAALEDEATTSFLLLSLGLPFVISSGGLRGVLEAFQRFDLINAIRVPTGVLTYLAPLIVLPYGGSLPPMVAVLVLVRIGNWVAHYVACRRGLPTLRWGLPLQRAVASRLMRFGGWMTVSNVISPLMTYSDRFVIGGLLPVAAVAYYVTPYEVATKLWLIPGAITGVIFPALATARLGEATRAVKIYQSGLFATTLALFPIVLVLSTFAPEALDLWLGEEFARQSSSVLRWLSAAVLINSAGQVAGAAIQAFGRPDLTAKLHAAEFPFYVVGLWWLIAQFGLVGAAIAWTLRVTIDTAALLLMAHRLLPIAGAALRPAGVLVAAVATMVLATVPSSAAARGAILILGLAAAAVVARRLSVYAFARPEPAGTA